MQTWQWTIARKTVMRKWKKQNTIKYTTWNVSGMAHKWEELGSVLNEKQIQIAAITESQKKLKGTMETNNYIVTYSSVNRSIWAQAGVMIWIHTQSKSQLLTTHTGAKNNQGKAKYWKREILIFWTLCPRWSWRKQKLFITNYRK
jgi:hypothetical protein